MKNKPSQNALAKVVAANIRTYRLARGWSQPALVARLAEFGSVITRETLAMIETGRRWDITVDELAEFGAVFGIDPWTLTYSVCHRCEGKTEADFTCSNCGATGAEETRRDLPG